MGTLIQHCKRNKQTAMHIRLQLFAILALSIAIASPLPSRGDRIQLDYETATECETEYEAVEPEAVMEAEAADATTDCIEAEEAVEEIPVYEAEAVEATDDCVEDQLVIEPGLTMPDLTLDLDDYISVNDDGQVFDMDDVACADPVEEADAPVVTTPAAQEVEQTSECMDATEEPVEIPTSAAPVRATTEADDCYDDMGATEELPIVVTTPAAQEATETAPCYDDMEATEELPLVTTAASQQASEAVSDCYDVVETAAPDYEFVLPPVTQKDLFEVDAVEGDCYD